MSKPYKFTHTAWGCSVLLISVLAFPSAFPLLLSHSPTVIFPPRHEAQVHICRVGVQAQVNPTHLKPQSYFIFPSLPNGCFSVLLKEPCSAHQGKCVWMCSTDRHLGWAMAQAAVGILPHLQNAAYRVSDHCGGMLTCANSAGQNLNVPLPTAVKPLSFFCCCFCFLQRTEQLLFRPKFNPSFATMDHNDLKVLWIWLLFFFFWCFFLLFWSKPDLLRIEIFPWGSQRKNPILLKIPWRMIATFTFYCSAPQHKNIWNLFNHISSHTKAIKSTLQIIYDSTQCNIIHNTILIISEKNGIPQPIRFSWPACNKDWISFHPALVSVRMN